MVARRLVTIGFCLCIVTGMLAWTVDSMAQRRGRASRIQAKEAKTEVMKQLDEGMRLLKQKRVREFARELVVLDDVESLGEFVNELEGSNEKRERLAKLLSLFRSGTGTLTEDGVFELVVSVDDVDEEFLSSEKGTGLVTQKEDAALGDNGFGADLKSAVQQGLEVLQQEQHKQFILGMFPESELKRLGENPREMDVLVERLMTYPVLGETMERELGVLLKLEPKYEQDGAVAVFTLPADASMRNQLSHRFNKIGPSYERTVKFELQHGHWRFFDSGKAIAREREQQLKGRTYDGMLVLPWENVNGVWKISEFPL